MYLSAFPSTMYVSDLTLSSVVDRVLLRPAPSRMAHHGLLAPACNITVVGSNILVGPASASNCSAHGSRGSR